MQVGSSSSVQLSPIFPGQGVTVSVTDAEGILQASPVALNLSAFSTGHVSFRRYARERESHAHPLPPAPMPRLHTCTHTSMHVLVRVCVRACMLVRVSQADEQFPLPLAASR
jgi:hypothetical protein